MIVLDAPLRRPVEIQTPPWDIRNRLCMAVASWQENCRDSMPHSLWHPAR